MAGVVAGLGPMSTVIDIADESFVVATPAAVAERLSDPDLWRTWWPDLVLTVSRDRGVKGVRWDVAGRVCGTGEIWIEPWGDGVVVHWFLRGRAARRAARLQRAYVADYKRRIHRLKDEFEQDRPVGEPRTGAAR